MCGEAMKLYVKRVADDEVVSTVDVTGRSETQIERIMSGMLRNMNTEEYYIDDAEIAFAEQP